MNFNGKKVLMLGHSGFDVSNLIRPYFEVLKLPFAEFGLELELLDLNHQEALAYLGNSVADPRVLFYFDINGVGSTASFKNVQTQESFTLYQVANKPCVRLIGDPIFVHEIWNHFKTPSPNQILLFSDYTSMFFAHQLDHPASRLFFYNTFAIRPDNPDELQKIRARGIDVLFPLRLSDPDFFRNRLIENNSSQKELTLQLFDGIIEHFLFEYRSDPTDWTSKVFTELGVQFDLTEDWHRNILSEAWHYIRQKRRALYLNELKQTPIYLVTGNLPDGIELNKDTTVVKNIAFGKLLKLMENSKIVINPPVSYKGFHERVVSAMYRGALAFTAPNLIFESKFIDGEHLVAIENHQELKGRLDEFSSAPQKMEEIALRGRYKAESEFDVSATVRNILTIFSNLHAQE